MDEFLGLELLHGCTCNFACFCQFACQRAGIGDHTSFGNEDFVAEKSECLGKAVALDVPALHLRGCPGVWGATSSSGLPAALWGRFSILAPLSIFMCPPLQVLHQVLAVAGLPRVPEEHDVWSEVQALQVMSGGWQRRERGHKLHTSSLVSLATWFLASGQITVQRNSFESSKICL